MIILVFLLLTASRAPAADDIIGASSDHHLWLILEPSRQATAYELVHHPWDETPWRYRTQHTMSQPPTHMAAWDDQIWLVMTTRSIAGRQQREVYAARVERNPATGLYYTMPAGRLEMVPPLTGLGRLAGFVATSDGPVALLLPAPHPSVSIVGGEGAAAGESFLERPTLQRLDRAAGAWKDITLPADFEGSRGAMLAVAGDDLVILETAADNPVRCIGYFQHRGAGWKAVPLALDLRHVRTLTSVAGQAVAVMSDRATPDSVALTYIRPGGLLALTTLPRPDGKWLIAGFDDRLVLIERERGGETRLNIRTIDPLTGAITAPQAFDRQPITAGRLWQVTLLLGLALTAVVAVMMLRPASAETIGVDVTRVLPAGRRLAGGVVDMAVAALPTMLLMDCSLADLLNMPMVSIAQSGPYVVLAALASVVATLLEMAFGRSVGKMVVGGEVVGLDGKHPSRWRVVFRGAIRFLVMLVPPLAVFAMTNNHMQGLPDMAARTLVLSTDPPPQQDSPTPNG